MILVIGGFFQGKSEYIKMLPQYGRPAAGRQGAERQGAERQDVWIADGKKDPPEQALESPVILGFHHYVRRLADEVQLQKLMDRLIRENPDAIITMDEVGSGIVPMEPEERAYRELAGLAGQRLAREAEEVHRVVCGIGRRIK